MSSSYAPSPKRYDVFISFRGEDTRTNFTSHLHSALCQHNIRTYIDYNLNKGDEVWPALAKAIQDSHVSIVVFSQNYASSKWCLEELVKILQCRKDQGQVVIPVFYKTDPSHIRKHTGSYKKAFAKHERDLGNNESNQYEVSNWKAALTEAANLSGWDSRTHKNDSQIIRNIVNDVSQKLYLRYPNEIKGLVRIDENSKDIESLLKEFRVIGIWGMGGLGKTTIAKVLFAKLFPQYDSVCFLTNVREESKRIGLTSLRDKLLFELLKEESPKNNVVGSTFIMRGLSSKKVLIVLDDVDSFEQLEYLCGECGDLGPGSRLIITTRDRHLLNGRVDEIYEVKKWSFPDSLKLFSLNAFKESHPQKGYENLSERAVHYAGGVPLALKVLGKFLYSRSTEFWDGELRKLMKFPKEEIQNVLKVSYDGLDRLQKEIFLDIAFFLKDKYKDYIVSILDACGFYAASGIEILVDKALITISYGNRIQMHDLLQEMGLEIVRQECSKDPGKRSRLRDIEEVYDVLKNNKGTDAVEGITLDLSDIKELHLSADTFNSMTNLRFLKFYISLGKRSGNVYLPRVLESFSDKLRYFEWSGYPSKSLPATFYAKLLVEFRMPHSHLKELWQGTQDLVNLEGIDLSECKQLVKLPDLSGASKLKWVNLSGCESLPDVHSSVLSLDTLETLILDRCKKLRSLKREMHLRSLQKLSVNGCTSLVTVSTLKTFAAQMKGKDKRMSFENSMRLDERSLYSIMDDALLTMTSAAFHNILVSRHKKEIYSYNQNSVEVCLPGSKVPGQFTYRTSKSSTITINELPCHSQLLGFMFSVVVSPSRGMKNHVDGAKIRCQCYWGDGTKVGRESTWDYKATEELKSDHVFVWYDPFCCDSILIYQEREVSFEFCVTTDTGDRGEPDGLMIGMKECGVHLIQVSAFQSLLRELDLDLVRKVDLGLKLGLVLDSQQGLLTVEQIRLLYALDDGLELDTAMKLELELRRRAISTSIERSHGKEINGIRTLPIQNQSSSRDCLVENHTRFWIFSLVGFALFVALSRLI